MIKLCWLVPFLPLLGALIAVLGGRWLKERAHWPVVAGIALAFCVSLTLWANAGASVFESHGELGTQAQTVLVSEWIEAGAFRAPFEFRVDGLSTMMVTMVTFVAGWIAVFAAGYMAGDPGYVRFFACMGLFVASMTGLVLSNHYVLTYGCWEGVGTCSYLLIGFWHAKPAAAAAAKKAFMVNRLGDMGFAIALFWLWSVMPGHDLSYNTVLNGDVLLKVPAGVKLGAALLFIWAATAKSAQVPLYVWLPDAMEGPTPVSALIHAATMVTAGVYLVGRSAPLMMSNTVVPVIIAVIGCATALLAALIALTQTDLKRVLAYSTVSQLGYMFMALGCGVGGAMRPAVVAAFFHLFTHAFFKALLFLSAGSVMHGMGHVIDMRRFRGLRHRMPITCWTFAVGGLALAGVFPLAGFWSKDEILAALRLAGHVAHEQELGVSGIYMAIYWLAVLTAFLTAFYTGRVFFLTFFGPEKLPSRSDPDADPHEHDHSHDPHFGHESPRLMTTPLIVLAVCAAAVGVIFGPTGWFEGQIGRTPGFEHLGHAEHATDWFSITVGTLVGLGGLALSALLYAFPSPVPDQLATKLRPLYDASLAKFRIDEGYGRIAIAPTWFLAKLSAFLDIYVVDGLVRLTAWVPRGVGRDLIGPFQNGLVQFYAAATALGVTILMLFLLLG